MPSYVHVIGFRVQHVTYREDADLFRDFFDDADHHTDATLAKRLVELVAAEVPAARVEVLTASDDYPARGTVLEVTREGHRERAVRVGDDEPNDPQVVAILRGSFDAALGQLEPRSDLYATVMKGSEKRRKAALSRAATTCRSTFLRKSEERLERRDTIAALLRVLRELPLGDPLRAEVWGALSTCDQPEVHALTLECLRSGDAALTDDLLERQRTFVMEQLPVHVGNALSQRIDAPWVRRGRDILARWKIEPTGDAAKILEVTRHLEAALRALEGLRGPQVAAVREALAAQLGALKPLG